MLMRDKKQIKHVIKLDFDNHLYRCYEGLPLDALKCWTFYDYYDIDIDRSTIYRCSLIDEAYESNLFTAIYICFRNAQMFGVKLRSNMMAVINVGPDKRTDIIWHSANQGILNITHPSPDFEHLLSEGIKTEILIRRTLGIYD